LTGSTVSGANRLRANALHNRPINASALWTAGQSWQYFISAAWQELPIAAAYEEELGTSTSMQYCFSTMVFSCIYGWGRGGVPLQCSSRIDAALGAISSCSATIAPIAVSASAIAANAVPAF
jgi:hypothetical protein